MGCCSYIHSFVGAFESLWLPEQARWVHLACSGFSASVLKERVFPFINQAWLDQYVVYWPHSFNCVFSGGSRGGAGGGGGGGAPPLGRCLGTPPPPPLSEGLDLPLVFTENAKKDSANIQPS